MVVGLACDMVASGYGLAHLPPRARFWLVGPKLLGSSLVRLLVRLRRQDVACSVVYRRFDYVSRAFDHVPPCSDYDLAPGHILDAEGGDDAQVVFFRCMHDVLDQGCRDHDPQGLDDDAQGLELDAQGFNDEKSFDNQQEALYQDLGSVDYHAQALDQNDHSHRTRPSRHSHRDAQPPVSPSADQPPRPGLGVQRIR
jgi:hypothetical protein